MPPGGGGGVLPPGGGGKFGSLIAASVALSVGYLAPNPIAKAECLRGYFTLERPEVSDVVTFTGSVVGYVRVI